MPNQQIAHLCDHRSIVDNAIEQLTTLLQRCREDLLAGPICGSERTRNLALIESLAQQLIHWVAEAQTVGELQLAPSEDGEPATVQPAPNSDTGAERNAAINELQAQLDYATAIFAELEKIRDSGSLVDVFDGFSPLRLQYFELNEKGDPDLTTDVVYSLEMPDSSVNERIDNPECARIIAQKRKVWAQFRSILEKEIVPRFRRELVFPSNSSPMRQGIDQCLAAL